MGSGEGEVHRILKFMIPRGSGLDLDTPQVTAERLLHRAAELAPKHYWTHFWLAWTLGEAGKYQAAELALNTCVALRPDFALGRTGDPISSQRHRDPQGGIE